jgi:hypothetical protein
MTVGKIVRDLRQNSLHPGCSQTAQAGQFSRLAFCSGRQADQIDDRFRGVGYQFRRDEWTAVFKNRQ